MSRDDASTTPRTFIVSGSRAIRKAAETRRQFLVCRLFTQYAVRYQGSTLRHWHHPLLEAMLCVELRMAPTFRYQEWQVVDPILLTHAAWVDHVAEVVFGIRDNKIGMGE